jgi:hypothetical protein
MCRCHSQIKIKTIYLPGACQAVAEHQHCCLRASPPGTVNYYYYYYY